MCYIKVGSEVIWWMRFCLQWSCRWTMLLNPHIPPYRHTIILFTKEWWKSSASSSATRAAAAVVQPPLMATADTVTIDSTLDFSSCCSHHPCDGAGGRETKLQFNSVLRPQVLDTWAVWCETSRKGRCEEQRVSWTWSREMCIQILEKRKRLSENRKSVNNDQYMHIFLATHKFNTQRIMWYCNTSSSRTRSVGRQHVKSITIQGISGEGNTNVNHQRGRSSAVVHTTLHKDKMKLSRRRLTMLVVLIMQMPR